MRRRRWNGSMWMSLARCCSASSTVLLTSRMIGASSPSGPWAPTAGLAASAPPTPTCLRSACFNACGGISAHCTVHPARNDRLSATNVLNGSSIATHSTPSLNNTGSASFCSACSFGTFLSASACGVNLAGSTNLRPCDFASTRQTATSSARFSAVIVRSSGVPRDEAADSALARRSLSKTFASSSRRRKVSELNGGKGGGGVAQLCKIPAAKGRPWCALVPRRQSPRRAASLGLEQHQVLQERDHGLLRGRRQRHECLPGCGGFPAVGEDRLGQRGGAAVVQVGRGRADSPQVLGQERAGAAAGFVDVLGQLVAHAVALQVAVERDG